MKQTQDLAQPGAVAADLLGHRPTSGWLVVHLAKVHPH